jgi:hypothetical protein
MPSASALSPWCPLCLDVRGTRVRMDGPIFKKATNSEDQTAAEVTYFVCGKCDFTMGDRRARRRSAADRFAGHARFQPGGDLVVEDSWDHDFVAPEAVLRTVSTNPEGFRIVYSDRVFHVTAGVDKRFPEDPYIGFAPCDCPEPQRRL